MDFEEYFQSRKFEGFLNEFKALRTRVRWREALQITAVFLLSGIITACGLAMMFNHIHTI